MFQKRALFRPQDSCIMSMASGYIYPCLVKEMYPNDKIIISHEALLRAAPMQFPLYSPMKLTFDYFYSENRLVWRGDESKDWSAFITGAVDGKAIEDPDDLPKMPYITVPSGGFTAGSLGDYLGFSSESALAGAKVSALRFRHYQKIIKDYYIDENFSTAPAIAYTEGQDTTTSLALQKRCWNKDRFTTATLTPQKGLSVGISLTGSIPVVTGTDHLSGSHTPLNMKVANGGTWGNNHALAVNKTNSNATFLDATASGLDSAGVYPSNLYADASDVDIVPIDELHFLTQIERLQQRDNLFGNRDFECIRTHFGCTPPNTGLQRAHWLGRSVVDVNFSEVLQTSQTTTGEGASAQGNITGHSLAVSANRPVRYWAREHGYLFVMVNVQPIAQYQQGIPRDAMYQTRYDYMWPILSETGEQEVYTAEVYATAVNVTSRKVFGFEPRYNHLRFGEKTVHGDFRTSLVAYHSGRIFPSEPNLGNNFITADPTNRMFAVELGDVQPWWLRVEFDEKLVRRLPKWPNPSAIGKIF